MKQREIWQTAMLLLDAKGPTATAAAHNRVVELLAEGDREGAAIWLAIASAIVQLYPFPPALTDTVH
jgi:hypothetical protein